MKYTYLYPSIFINSFISLKYNYCIISTNFVIILLAYYIYGMEGFLDTIGEYMEVHSTFKGDVSKIPNHIVNHGEYVIVMLITCKYYFPWGYDTQVCFLNQT